MKIDRGGGGRPPPFVCSRPARPARPAASLPVLSSVH
jgi:hypothetical protein